MKFRILSWIPILLMIAGLTAPGLCQEINLDKMKKAGDLVCYPSLKDPALWYYLPDRPRLATQNGKPQFSFMKYSRTNKTEKAGTNVAQGGGILHFLVTYGASKDRVRAAEKRLQENFPEARIEGPIVYRKGSFALITSFTRDRETLVKTVAVGKAPLMEGQKAAVSMALSREGAELLWESFKSDTPDISLIFDMEFAGIREPYEASIEADWSRVSKHKQLKAGFKYSWFGADVDLLFQELRQTGAIKITTKGENAAMDKIIESAHAKLLQVMFDPAPVDDLSRAAAEKDSYSNLNQAMKLIKEAKGSKTSMNLSSPDFRQMIAAVLDALLPKAHAAETVDLPGLTPAHAAKLTQMEIMPLKNHIRLAKDLEKGGDLAAAANIYKLYLSHYKEITQTNLPAPDLRLKIGRMLYSVHETQAALEWFNCCCHTQDCINFLHSIEQDQKPAEKAVAKPAPETAQKSNKSTQSNQAKATKPKPQKDTAARDQSKKESAESYNRARRLDNEAVTSGYDPEKTLDAIMAYEEYQAVFSPTGARAKEIEGRLRSLRRRFELAEEKGDAPGGPEKKKKNEEDLPPLPEIPLDTMTTDKKTTPSPLPVPPPPPTTAKTAPAKPAAPKPAKKTGPPPSSAVKKAVEKAPGPSLVASFKLKKIKRSGKMVYKMNHFRSEKQSFTMAENIGSLYSRYGRDSKIFKALTIDDPVFKQREILVTLDGQDTATFTRYMNFVTVKMKKVHQSGETTTDEVVITPEAFNLKANAFSLNYGYKGDTNRNLWLNYQYQVVWSFHGGLEIRSPWTKGTGPMLALTPPYRYRGLAIEGEGETLDSAGVRHAVVTLTSVINGRPMKTQATIKNQGPAPALHLDIPQGNGDSPVNADIKWFLKGGKTLESPSLALDGDILYWDELPGKGY